MEDKNKKHLQNQGLPNGIPSTDEAERSELSERLDRQIIKDHLSGDGGISNDTEFRKDEEPGASL